MNANTKQQPRKADPSIDGIPFVEDSPKPAEVIEIKRTVESDRRNQEAARRAIENLKVEPPQEMQQPYCPPLSEAKAASLKPRIFLVKKDRAINRGAAQYTLRAGKIISSNEYDIESLRMQGVEMEERS